MPNCALSECGYKIRPTPLFQLVSVGGESAMLSCLIRSLAVNSSQATTLVVSAPQTTE